MPLYSPLRYPGGKGKLTNFVKKIVEENDLFGGHYVEAYAGGGGGSNRCGGSAPDVAGGSGGGGRGSFGPRPTPVPESTGQAGTDNTGGGGGGGKSNVGGCRQAGGSGGSGIVVIRYKYQ